MAYCKPARLMTGEPNSFAAFTLAKRLPAILASLEEHADIYTGKTLRHLSSEILEDKIKPLPATIFGELRRFIEPYIGRYWREIPFLEAELYFYARILLAFSYTEANQIDPFRSTKDEANADAIAFLATSSQYCHPDLDITELLRWSVTGNSTDLSQLAIADMDQISLLVDDCQSVERLLNSGLQRVDFVFDNSGMDVLADLLLIRSICKRCPHVVAHVRPYPMYVSDVTLADMNYLIKTLASASAPPIQLLAVEVMRLLQAGHLAIRASPDLGLPICFCEDGERTLNTFGNTDLVIFKGDLNYRYFVGDRRWPHTTDKGYFANLFGRSAIALRTLKSEVIVGLPTETSAKIDQLEPEWLTNGHHGIIQAFTNDSPRQIE